MSAEDDGHAPNLGTDITTLSNVAASGNAAQERSSRNSIVPGVVLGERYELFEELGAGAMGTVYRARHSGLGTLVAVKVLRPSVQDNPEYERRFKREARAAYQLDHPHVVRVLDFGYEPVLYIVMEYIEGQSLASYLDGLDAPPALSFTIQVMDQMLSALSVAHERGIIHRDLKPDNVLLTWRDSDPFVKVVDFGLAHFDDVFDAGPTLTQQGVVAGTPAYMSPEQCQSMSVTPASDLYSMGCILTELLQLTPPFEADSAVILMSQQMFVRPPALKRPPNAEPVPASLEALRLELLAKQGHRRPKSARSVSERLHPERDTDSERGSRRSSSRGSLSPKAARTKDARGDRRIRVALFAKASGSDDATFKAGLAFNGIDVAEDGTCYVGILDEPLPHDAAIERIRELTSGGMLLLVLLSSIDAARLPELIEAGAADVMARPADVVALSMRLHHLFRRSERRAQSTEPL